MNIQLLFQALTPEEKKELYQCFSGNEYKAHRATISEFMTTIPSGRVKTSLRTYMGYYGVVFLDEVVEHRLMMLPNCGKKTWHDFQELLKDRI